MHFISAGGCYNQKDTDIYPLPLQRSRQLTMMFKVLPRLVALGPTSIVNSDLRGMFYNTVAIAEDDSSTAVKEI